METKHILKHPIQSVLVQLGAATLVALVDTVAFLSGEVPIPIVLFFAAVAIFLLFNVASANVAGNFHLVEDDKGLRLHSWMGDSKVGWEEIARVVEYELAGHRMVGIRSRNPQKDLSSPSGFLKAMFGSPYLIAIDLSMFAPGEAEPFLQRCRARVAQESIQTPPTPSYPGKPWG